MDGDGLVSAERDVQPAFDLFGVARNALCNAKDKEEGSLLELLTAILMASLAFEAVLNQLGEHVWGGDSAIWASVERSSPVEKLKAIAEKTGFTVDLGSRPAQTLRDVVRFRNDVVHAKPQHFEARVPRAVVEAGLLSGRVEELSARWELQRTVDFAERALTDLSDLAGSLAAHIGVPHPFQIGGSAGWTG